MRVDDLQAYLDRAAKLGGRTVVPPTPLAGDFGSFAVLADPDGQLVGLWA
jgi:predicted enzyme related to lactoylglutathione lyase